MSAYFIVHTERDNTDMSRVSKSIEYRPVADMLVDFMQIQYDSTHTIRLQEWGESGSSYIRTEKGEGPLVLGDGRAIAPVPSSANIIEGLQQSADYYMNLAEKRGRKIEAQRRVIRGLSLTDGLH